MRFFGQADSATLAPHPVPVGKLCAARCGHDIAEGDVGYLLPHTGEFDAGAMTLVAGEPHAVFHMACLLDVLELSVPSLASS